MKIDKTGNQEITIRIESDDERDALIQVLDMDRNHPARSLLYDTLREFRQREQTREQMKSILATIDALSFTDLLRVQNALRSIGAPK